MSESVEFLKKYLKVLEGGKIIETNVLSEDDGFGFEEDFQVLAVEMPDGTIYQLDVLMDPEGNGPGHLDISKVK